MELKTLRNVAIVVAIGVGVYFIPGGGHAASGVESVLWVLAAIAIGYFGLRLYRENQFRLSSLGDRHRGLLYGAIALAVFCYMAFDRMTGTGLGTLVWAALVGVVLWALLEVYRHFSSYS
jgi:hypothetical protein